MEPSLLPSLLEVASKTDFPKDQIFLFSDKETGTIEGIRDWREILPSVLKAESAKWRAFNAEQSRNTIAALNYSSGTTGLPKGVMISHQNVIANVEQSVFMRNLEQPYKPESRPVERWLGFLPCEYIPVRQ